MTARLARVLTAAVAALVLAGCGPAVVPAPGRSSVARTPDDPAAAMATAADVVSALAACRFASPFLVRADDPAHVLTGVSADLHDLDLGAPGARLGRDGLGEHGPAFLQRLLGTPVRAGCFLQGHRASVTQVVRPHKVATQCHLTWPHRGATLCGMTNAANATTGTTHCHRCGRRLTAIASVARGYGRGCAAKIAAAAKTVDAKPEQVAKAAELVADGGILRAAGALFLAVASDGVTRYEVDSVSHTCSCRAGQHGRRCYHVVAADLLAAA